jgi:hypothetical protein
VARSIRRTSHSPGASARRYGRRHRHRQRLRQRGFAAAEFAVRRRRRCRSHPPFGLGTSRAVLAAHAAEISDEPPASRHNELADRRCMRCDPNDLVCSRAGRRSVGSRLTWMRDGREGSVQGRSSVGRRGVGGEVESALFGDGDRDVGHRLPAGRRVRAIDNRLTDTEGWSVVALLALLRVTRIVAAGGGWPDRLDAADLPGPTWAGSRTTRPTWTSASTRRCRPSRCSMRSRSRDLACP